MPLGQSRSSWPVGPVEHATPMEVLPLAFFVDEPELGLPLSPGIATANGADASDSHYLAGSGFLCQRLMTAIAILSRRKRAPSGEVRGMAQSSLWRLGVVECSEALRCGELTQVYGARTFFIDHYQ